MRLPFCTSAVKIIYVCVEVGWKHVKFRQGFLGNPGHQCLQEFT